METVQNVRIELGGEVRFATEADWQTVADELVAKHGGVPRVEKLKAPEAVYSDFGDGNQVVDEAAKVRIEALHAKLQANGVKVDAANQLYATGTRMAKVGYDNQAQRRAEHDKKTALQDAAGALRGRVEAEQREDVTVSAAELGKSITVNGKVMAFGLGLGEQAIRGLAARLESPMVSYVMGLRNRIAAASVRISELRKSQSEGGIISAVELQQLAEGIKSDKAEIAGRIQHECARNPDVELKLRTRKANGDVFAVVSPSYGVADAPQVLAELLGHLPSDAKGTWSYDPSTMNWELRADVWTPTPVEQKAVGEPFEGYASFRGVDNGTGRVGGGGGIILLACLNAGTYEAAGRNASRIHRSGVLVDFDELVKQATASIAVFCDAMGKARQDVVEVPKGLTIGQAIPGFWRHLLTARHGELAGVLRGRTENNVKVLTEAYFDQRRDSDKVVRSDFAQAWTCAIQGSEAEERRNAELAVGSWLVKQQKMLCDMGDA